jgi:hypothetical protein
MRCVQRPVADQTAIGKVDAHRPSCGPLTQPWSSA